MMSLTQFVALTLLIGSVLCYPVEDLSETELYSAEQLIDAQVQEDYEPEFPNLVEEAGYSQEVTEEDIPDFSDITEAEDADLEHPLITYGDVAVKPRSRNAAPCTLRGCKWPKHANGFVYVPVVISSRYNQTERNIIIKGLTSLHNTTCIRFVWWNGHRDYLYIYPGQGCWSFVGRQGGQQALSLQRPGCVYHHVVQHEMLHALGFHHEQVRSDRNNHVIILEENIIPGKERNFRQIATNNLWTPYDYRSVMHYGRYYFSKDRGRLPTIIPKPNPNVTIGLATQMSRYDVLRVKRLYMC
ncbi:high choriolytic enzyme 1-like [Colossoma macropomum]|uniref:high choriolytic enzyme 1-like n=1 Tax=Colossoma macropomum TaxID=42526 RepID=UPI001863E1C2|nr:high choriolytic enzyme 1-like [Colossoma macropomum]